MKNELYMFRAWLSTRLLILTLYVMPESRTKDEVLDALQEVIDRREVK